MKKTLLFTALILCALLSSQAQETVTVKFTAALETGGYCPFSSVVATNITRGWTTTLAYPDTVLMLSQPGVGVTELQSPILNMGTPFPNPFINQTCVPLALAETSEVTLKLIRANGEVIASRNMLLNSGVHGVTVNLSYPGLTFLSVETLKGRSVTRLVCMGNGGSDDIEVNGIAANLPQVSKGSVSSRGEAPGVFEPGDLMRYEAFRSVGGTTFHSAVVEQMQYTSETVTLFFAADAPEGAIDGLFTINEQGGKAYFAMGNLQYDKTTGVWSFMQYQYDQMEMLGQDVGEDYASQNIVGLFGWSTSGYEHGGDCYQPWSTSTYYHDYYPYLNNQFNLYDQTGQADWGYNAISNGGNTENQWRTLTKEEWEYVFNTRVTASGIRYAKGQVGGVNGVILLPDDWSGSYYSLNYPNTSTAYFDCNLIDLEQWTTIEEHGAVFLPAAGYRLGTEVFNTGSSGHYWASSRYNDSRAYCIGIYYSGLYPQAIDFLQNGFSVRLVQVAFEP